MTFNLPSQPSRRQTKIVITMGPACRGPDAIRALLEAGADLVRLNFSHITYDHAREAVEIVRRESRRLGKPVAILQDLQGPRMRINGFANGSATLRDGQEFTLTTKRVQGTDQQVSVSYPRLPQEVSRGDRILLHDGLIRLRVLETTRHEIKTLVETGGVLTPKKGLNVPGVSIQAPPITEKDLKDLEFGLRLGVDYVALSFVRGPEDARVIREAMVRLKRKVPVIAKIERAEAVDAMDDILRAFDGVMVARGDLGVEIGPERVPLVQKRIIARANALLKPVITATQMLESMVTNPTPTRAEASDVANAILDGTDAIMLSEETSIGAYPVEAVRIMDRIAVEVDAVGIGREPSSMGSADPARAVVAAAHNLANEIKARAIAVFTTSGRTALLIAKHRPQIPALAFVRSEAIYNRLALYWGISSVLTPFTVQTTEMIAFAEEVLVRANIVKPGDRVVMVGSAPLTAHGRTNFIKAHTIQRKSRRPNGSASL